MIGAKFDGVDDAPDLDVEEASTLGFPPGQWPETFRYDGQRMFLQHIERDTYGETLWADYGYDGGVLRVFND
jgi:hypothetical protein